MVMVGDRKDAFLMKLFPSCCAAALLLLCWCCAGAHSIEHSGEYVCVCADSLVICLRNRVEGIVYIEEERQPDVYQNDFRIYIAKEINRIASNRDGQVP
jgi:hypothetical protein